MLLQHLQFPEFYFYYLVAVFQPADDTVSDVHILHNPVHLIKDIYCLLQVDIPDQKCHAVILHIL